MDTSWLDKLENRVRQAAEALAAVREQNRDLRKQVETLERATQGGGESDVGDWEVERQEIRRRVEKLVAGLEALLEE